MKIRFLTLLCLAMTFSTPSHADSTKRIALVFDDGPKIADTEPLLALLAREKIHVTFALVGARIDENPDTVKIIADAGHEIINHSQTHAHPRNLDDEALGQEIFLPQQKITALTGQAPRWYWPPFLEVTGSVREEVARRGLTIYTPHKLVVSMDYDTNVSADDIFRFATQHVEEGAVILFHEWRTDTRTQLPAILAELRRQHCVFLTFSALHDALTAEAP